MFSLTEWAKRDGKSSDWFATGLLCAAACLSPQAVLISTKARTFELVVLSASRSTRAWMLPRRTVHRFGRTRRSFLTGHSPFLSLSRYPARLLLTHGVEPCSIRSRSLVPAAT